MDSLFTIIGVLGSICCILAYFLLERGYAKGSDIWYYALNGIGAGLVLIGAMYDFDGGDLGAVTQEVCWVMISGTGVYKLIKQRKTQRKDSF
jgi:hypothetical protein